MKKIFLYCPFLFTAVLFCSCSSQGENPEQIIAAANALDQQFVEAYSNGDVEGVMATYWNSPDLVSYPPGAMEERGWQKVKEGLSQFFTSIQGAKLVLFDSENKIAGDMILGKGKWSMTMPDGNGGSMEMFGRYSDIKAKRDGKWVYVFDHASVPLPPGS